MHGTGFVLDTFLFLRRVRTGPVMEGYTFEEEDFDLTEYLNNVLGGIDSSSGDAEPTTSDYNKAIKA